MNIFVSWIIQLWIIFYFVQTINSGIIVKKHKNTSEVDEIYLERNTDSNPVIYNLEEWLAKQKPSHKKLANLTILPILAILVFLWIVCFRICKWIRDDSKFDERGCSYDVTSYVILTQEDRDFTNLKESDSSLVFDTITSARGLQNRIDNKVYDTSSSFKSILMQSSTRGLQNRIDYKMYDTVSSYRSMLKQTKLRSVRRSPTPDKLEPTTPKGQIQRGRFYITPVIDNYVRFKTTSNGTSRNVNLLRVKEGEIFSVGHIGNTVQKPKSKKTPGSENSSTRTRNNTRPRKKNAAVQKNFHRRKEKRKIAKDAKESDSSPSKYVCIHNKDFKSCSHQTNLKCNSERVPDTEHFSSISKDNLNDACNQRTTDNKNVIYTTVTVHNVLTRPNQNINNSMSSMDEVICSDQCEVNDVNALDTVCPSNTSETATCLDGKYYDSDENGLSTTFHSDTSEKTYLDRYSPYKNSGQYQQTSSERCVESHVLGNLSIDDNTVLNNNSTSPKSSDNCTGTDRLLITNDELIEDDNEIGDVTLGDKICVNEKHYREPISDSADYSCSNPTFHILDMNRLTNSEDDNFCRHQSQCSPCVDHRHHVSCNNDTCHISEGQKSRLSTESKKDQTFYNKPVFVIEN